MKKMLLTMAITTALYGCGETLEDVKNESKPVVPFSTVKFDPSNGAVSVPNDLLFLGTKDGTLEMPGEKAANINYADLQTALGALDGWSVQTPYQIELILAPGTSLEATSVGPNSVRIFEVVMGASRTDEQCSQVPAGIACKLVRELQFGVDFVAQANGNNVAIAPLKPFTPGASYINVLTKELKDNQDGGRSINPSSTYALVQRDINQYPLVTASQKALQAVINSYENAVIQGGAITKDEIIYSGAMTIQSNEEVMMAAKSLISLPLLQQQPPTSVVQMGADNGLTLAMAMQVNDPTSFLNEVSLRFGTVNLTSFLKAPTDSPTADNPTKGLENTFWQANCDSGVAVAAFKAAAGENYPTSPISQNDGLCLFASNGALRDFTGAPGMPTLDTQRHLTKYNPLPKVQGLSQAKVQYTEPTASLDIINATRESFGLGRIAKPEAGWPLVILQHGITSKKEDMLGLAAFLTLHGFATVAIDHPMHGERGIDMNDDGVDEFNATTRSVLHYMNLSSMLVARDNLRQSAVDLLSLRLGLNFMQGTNANVGDVSFVGHSLGAVVAPNFAHAANSTSGNPTLDAMFKVQALALGSGAGGIAGFLFESEAFGGFIQASVLLQAGIAESAEFAAFVQTPTETCLPFAQQQDKYMACMYQSYLAKLQAEGATDKLANVSSVMSQFIFASQTVLDSADSNSFAAKIAASSTPIYQSVVVGDLAFGGENKPDTVIPPVVSAKVNPLAGTIPSAMLMGLETISQTELGTAPGKYLVKFVKGNHASIAVGRAGDGATEAEAKAANFEMQSQVASFLMTKGYQLHITNTDLVTE